jgi:hypothetical protein
VPDPGDYDDGEIGRMMIGRGIRSTRRKPAPVPLCPPQNPYACPDANPGSCGVKPTNNCLSYRTAYVLPLGQETKVQTLKKEEVKSYILKLSFLEFRLKKE